MGTWFVVFLLVKSNVYLHCCLFFLWWIMVLLCWIGLLDLVMAKKCGSLDYKGQRLVLWSGGLLQKKVTCFVKFLAIRNFWTFF